MKPINIGLLGLGTVGSGVIRLIEGHQDDLQRQIGTSLRIKKVAVRDMDKPRSVSIDRNLLTEDPNEVINDMDIDCIVEVMGGVEQTRIYVLESLRQKKHVVTANKDLMALHGNELIEEAARNGCDIFYEASVAGGIPIIRTLVDGFSSDRITKMMGIVNGTTNYILSKMSQEGSTYEEALAEAMKLGYAEPDPTSDVTGMDAAYKMTILGTLGFHTNVSIEDVDVTGIEKVTAEDILYGKRLGYEVKLLGIAERSDDYISLAVQPTMVRNTHPLATVNGVFNAVYVYGEAVGETMFYGPGAGELPTAMSVVADVVSVCKNIVQGVNGVKRRIPYREKKLKTDDQIEFKNFLCLSVADRAGVMARITEVFGRCNVSLESVLQQPNNGNSKAEITIITHHASKANMAKVLELLNELDVIYEIKSVYRVEG